MKCFNRRQLILVGFSLTLLDCASLRDSSVRSGPLQLPVAIQPLFSACTPSEGAAMFSLKADNKSIGGLEMIWSVPHDGQWDIQFNSVLGESLMEVKMRRGEYTVVGRSDVQIRRVEDGALTVNDAKLPILDHEAPCLFGGHWPASWLQFLKEASRKGGTYSPLSGSDRHREIEVRSSIAPTAQSVDSCAVVKWGGFLGLFKHASDVCIKRWSGGYSVSIDGPSNYSMKWSVEHDAN